MAREDTIRRQIAREAARLMYEEQIREYRDAKRKAAKRFGPATGTGLGAHLPSNSEIHAELERLIAFYEPEVRPERLFRMRLLALRYMEILAQFTPRLVGSVLTGAVTARSDIDLHLFASSPEEVAQCLRKHGIPFEQEVVEVRRGAQFMAYPHFYLEEAGVVIECSVYQPADLRRAPKSSITGHPMERADLRRLRRLIAEDGSPHEA